MALFLCIRYRHKSGMKFGYARVSTDGQSVAAQVAALRAAGAGKVFREVASGARTDRETGRYFHLTNTRNACQTRHTRPH